MCKYSVHVIDLLCYRICAHLALFPCSTHIQYKMCQYDVLNSLVASLSHPQLSLLFILQVMKAWGGEAVRVIKAMYGKHQYIHVSLDKCTMDCRLFVSNFPLNQSGNEYSLGNLLPV